MSCPCQSNLEYQNCCEPFHKKTQFPDTAEKLMRARYSAFAKQEIDFIADTHMPGTSDFDKEEARQWSESSEWPGLEIVKTENGLASDESGIVEFKAQYIDENKKEVIHHEISSFKKSDGKWFYQAGQIVGTAPLKRATPKVGRNEPCPCGSGKKYKKCCGSL